MKLRIFVLATLVVFFSSISFGATVSTTAIESVRKKDVLGESDFQVIDDFVFNAVKSIVRTQEFTEVSKLRTVLVVRKDSGVAGQQQYSERFLDSVHKHVSKAFEQAANIEPARRQFMLRLNLLILIDSCGSSKFADLAISRLDDKNLVLRYWAVRLVTNVVVIDQLNKGSSSERRFSREIASKLDAMAVKGSSEELSMIIRFAGMTNIAEGEALLLKIADSRLKQYSNWTVKNELLDNLLLRMLLHKTRSSVSSKGVGMRFGQLLSYVMQRYVKGENVLSVSSKNQLRTVLTETELRSFTMKPLSLRQQTIRKAIKEGKLDALMAEHDRLLGTVSDDGKIGISLGYDYGTAPNGMRRTGPLVLSDPVLKKTK